MKSICRHCHAEAVTRPRGLGWKCYYTPWIRAMYPSISKYARRGIGADTTGSLPIATEPTDARPGSEAKVEILLRRAQQGVALFHPGDETLAVRPNDKRQTEHQEEQQDDPTDQS